MLTQQQFLKNLHYIKKKINKHFNPPLLKVFYLYKPSINWFLQSIQNLANELLLYIPLDHIKSISLLQLIQISLLIVLWSFI